MCLQEFFANCLQLVLIKKNAIFENAREPRARTHVRIFTRAFQRKRTEMLASVEGASGKSVGITCESYATVSFRAAGVGQQYSKQNQFRITLHVYVMPRIPPDANGEENQMFASAEGTSGENWEILFQI